MPDGLSGVWIDLKLRSGKRFCYCYVVYVILSLLQDLTTVCIFLFVLALNVTDVISMCKDIC